MSEERTYNRHIFPFTPTTRHGTNNGYSYGCRCDDCRRAASEYRKALRARRKAEGNTR